MSGQLWYKRYPSDFLNGVAGMGPAVIGCYAVVLDLIYDRGGPIPNDTRWLGGLLGCSSRMARVLITRLIDKGKLFECPSGLTNGRAETELRNIIMLHNSRVESGAKGGRTRGERARLVNDINKSGQAGLKHARATRSYKNNSPSFLGGVLDLSQDNKRSPGSGVANQNECTPATAEFASRLSKSNGAHPTTDPEPTEPEAMPYRSNLPPGTIIDTLPPFTPETPPPPPLTTGPPRSTEEIPVSPQLAAKYSDPASLIWLQSADPRWAKIVAFCRANGTPIRAAYAPPGTRNAPGIGAFVNREWLEKIPHG